MQSLFSFPFHLVLQLFPPITLSIPLSFYPSLSFSDKTDSFICILKGLLHPFEINETTLHLDLLHSCSVLYSLAIPFLSFPLCFVTISLTMYRRPLVVTVFRSKSKLVKSKKISSRCGNLSLPSFSVSPLVQA